MPHLTRWRLLVTISSFLIVPIGWLAPSFGHEHDADDGTSHKHPHTESGLFTTRDAAKVIPPPKASDVFHFVIYGDRTGGYPSGLKVLEQAVKDTNLLDPDMVLTVGDLIQGYNQKPEWMREMKEFKAIMNRLKMQWFPVAGNHDVYWRGPGKAPEGHHESGYEQHFGPLWYSFEHKNAGFIVLYSDEGDPETNEKGFHSGRLQTMSDRQLSFLKSSLEKLAGSDHVFVFLHHPRWISKRYEGSNWDTVHEMLRDAGNVSAVFAGHIHQMHFAGPKDGIAYYALATTGGHLSADIPGAGYLHHLNIVSVRKDTYSVAALPVGAVIDPKEFDDEFLRQIALARSIRPKISNNHLQLTIDGEVTGKATITLANPSDHPVTGTLSVLDPSGSWISSLDHQHIELPAGESAKDSTYTFERASGNLDSLRLPRVQLGVTYIGETARIKLPDVTVPIDVRLAAIPVDYFQNQSNQCLNITSAASAVRVNSSELKVPDGPMTLEAWVRPRATTGLRGVVAKTEKSEFALFLDEGVPQFDIHLDRKYVTARASDPLLANQWTHLAGVFDGSRVKIFVGGKLVGDEPGSGKRTTNKLPMFIGADPDRAGQPTRAFSGKIDEVRLMAGATYKENFTPEERHQPSGKTALLLHCDRTLGPFLLDHSPNAAKAIASPRTKLSARP